MNWKDGMDEQLADIAALARRSAGGDRTAFAGLIASHERTALAIAYGMLGCASSAADVAQEAFLRAWQRLGELDDPTRFSAWFARIVRNLAVDTLRRRPRAESGVESGHLATVATPETDDPLQVEETRQRINAALSELDEVTRMTVTLRYYQNLSSREIGPLVGLSPAAVDMRLSRARAQLRARLADHDSCDEPASTARDTVGCAGGGAAPAGGSA